MATPSPSGVASGGPAAASARAPAPPAWGGANESSHAGGPGGRPPGGEGGPPETPEARNLRLAFFRQTDLGNVFRFVERFRGHLLYNETLPGAGLQGGGWLWWDGRRWATAGADARVRIAEHDCVRAIGDEAAACEAEARRLEAAHADIVERTPAKKPRKGVRARGAGDETVIAVDFRARKKMPPADGGAPPAAPDDRDAEAIAGRIGLLWRLAASLRRWARASEANSKLSPIARHAAAYLRVEFGDLDADPLMLNVLNGTLVFRRDWTDDPSVSGHAAWRAHGACVKFKPHDPRDLNTKIAPVHFDPDAGCPRFLAFLAEVQPDVAMRAFLQTWKGYGLTGETGEARMCIFHGEGRNGKGVFEDVTGYVLGDYGGSAPVNTFLVEGQSRGAGQATPELAKLPGIRSLRTSEPKRDAKLDEALIKLVTGGDPIDARHLNRPFFTFLPAFKLTMLTNHKPKIAGVDEGIWARVTLVPWGVVVPEGRRDPRLAAKLKAEASGVLNWMLDGLAAWFERGLALPDAVREATRTYRSDSDPLGEFLVACTEPAAGERVQASPLHACFLAWSKANAGPEWTARGFAMAMTGRGYRAVKASVMYWLDLRMTRQASDFVDADGRPHGERGRREEDDDLVFE